MFDNKYIADRLLTLGKLLQVNGAEDNRVEAFFHAANVVRGLDQPVRELLNAGTLESDHSIETSIRKTIEDLDAAGISPLLEQLLEDIPLGVTKMLDLNGLGPKKARVIWTGMGIDNLGELYYACIQNRLVEEKGFGFKTQEKIRSAIEAIRDNDDQFLYANLEPHADAAIAILQETFGADVRACLTGDMRRKMPIVSGIDILCDAMLYKDIMLMLIRSGEYEILTAGTDLLQVSVRDTRIHVNFLFKGINFFFDLLQTTGPEEHVALLNADPGMIYPSEEAIYKRSNLQFVEPELRDQEDILELAAANNLPQLIEFGDLKGLLHAHSTWSDGLHTLEEMAIETRSMGLEYLGITEHSKSSVAANGLTEARITAQHEEIDRLNQMLHPFRILKGIEADILPDGELDYDSMTLAGFDFVIASIHSDLEMTEEQATHRLIQAIRNPFTNILGHATGRLLLARKGYDIDHRRIIDECAENGVAIELNGSPHRMDLDWKWIRYAIDKKVQISINPDAHRKEDLAHVHFGIATARKGMLTQKMTLNARSLAEIEEFFMQKRKHRIR
jgi:DNA polymerase (family 10)